MKNQIPHIPFQKQKADGIDFEIFSLQDLYARDKNQLDHSISLPHRVNFPLIIFISEGKGHHFIDFKKYPFQKGSIIFIAKEQVQSFEPHPSIEGFIILFTENFIWNTVDFSKSLNYSLLYNYHSNSPVLNPEDMPNEEFFSLTNQIHQEYNHPDHFGKEEIISSLMNFLFLKAERIFRKDLNPKREKKLVKPFNSFRNLLIKNYKTTRNANDYAKMMNISYKHLNDICKAVLGQTAKGFIDNYLILETKRHLASADISIKELTFEMGFDEPTNFIKFFKKHTQQTPSQFKKTFSKQKG